MNLKSVKVEDADTGTFTETVKFKVLHCGNVEGNNNKFYCAELQKDPRTNKYRIFTHYGRLGGSGIFEIREAPSGSDLYEVEREFEKLVEKKLKGKTKKDDDGNDRTEKYEMVDVIAPTIGSGNIRNKASAIEVKVTDFIGKLEYEPPVITLLRQLKDENIHNITQATTIKVTANGLETPLGPVTNAHIDVARNALDSIRSFMKKGKIEYSSRDVLNAVNKYFSLIPRKFVSYRISEDDYIDTADKLTNEYELLDQLETAIQTNNTTTDDKKIKDLGFTMKLLKDPNDLKLAADKFVKTRANNHKNIWSWKVKKVYEVLIKKDRERFNKYYPKLSTPNFTDLYHGSKNCNILSILCNGFIIPPVNASFVTGRMFGNGVYAASNSTKALNYSIGYWSGSKNKFPNSFVFLVKFAMGKTYEVDQSCHDGAPHGYDSIHAKEGRSLINDEWIIYNLGQATITHLLELEEK